jgi:two-component system capsular synthesis sensor histidine kinase RcsC
MNRADRSHRVLIIDDRAGIREVFRDFLDLLGYAADAAVDGTEGLEMLERGDYGLVLTDLKMPGINGIDVATSVRRSRPETAVIVVSGSAVPDEVEFIRRLGFAYLQKPVILRDFTAAVARAFSARALGRPVLMEGLPMA